MTYHHGNLRTELLDRAAHVIAESGIEGLSLRGLARDLGVSHAAPSRHFKDKADLLRALATEANDRLTNAVLNAAEQAGSDPLRRYNAMGQATVRFSLEQPAYFRVLNHPEVGRHAGPELYEADRRRTETVRRAAAAAQAAGWLPDSSLDEVYLFSVSAVWGLGVVLADPLRSSGLSDPDALIARFVSLVINPEAPQKTAPASLEKLG